ncbi:MAG: hypothetical protein K0S07_25 [Chlamydiales bacterium]|nr:hypothetical protein [Chlamydiales bacterium]
MSPPLNSHQSATIFPYLAIDESLASLEKSDKKVSLDAPLGISEDGKRLILLKQLKKENSPRIKDINRLAQETLLIYYQSLVATNGYLLSELGFALANLDFSALYKQGMPLKLCHVYAIKQAFSRLKEAQEPLTTLLSKIMAKSSEPSQELSIADMKWLAPFFSPPQLISLAKKCRQLEKRTFDPAATTIKKHKISPLEGIKLLKAASKLPASGRSIA